MKEMGTVPLLTKEKEIEIAKRIEEGKEKVCKIIFSIPFFLQRLIPLGNMVMNGKAPLAEIIQDGEGEAEEDLVAEKKRFFKLIEKISALYQKREAYLKKLKTSSSAMQTKLILLLRMNRQQILGKVHDLRLKEVVIIAFSEELKQSVAEIENLERKIAEKTQEESMCTSFYEKKETLEKRDIQKRSEIRNEVC